MKPYSPSSVRPRWLHQRLLGSLIALAAIAVSLLSVGFQQTIFNFNGLPQLWRFLATSVHPDLSPAFLQVVLKATLTTLAYAVCGTFLSLLIGAVGGLLASEVWWSTVSPHQKLYRLIYPGIRATLAIPRAIHELIWGLFFINILGLDPLVAILAIAIPYGAIVAKVFSEILDETPRQPLSSLLGSGVAPLTAFIYSLIPQASLNLISYAFYRFECSIRSAAVLGIIGAGGLGYEILLSLQSLRYQQLWTLFFALFFLNGAVDWGSALLRQRLGSPTRLDLNVRKRPTSQRLQRQQSPTQDPLLLLAGIGILVLIPFSFWYVAADFSKLWSSRTAALLIEVGQTVWPPHFNQMPQLAPLLLHTLAMSILAIAIAGVGGVLLAFPAARNFFLPGGLLETKAASVLERSWAWMGIGLTRAALLMARAIPAPIWALMALFILFPGILPGAIALGIHNMGILGRLMAEVIEDLDQRPLMALKSQGVTAPLLFLYGILPLTFTRFLAYILYRWEVCMRETVIVGLVGAGGLGRLLTEQLSSFDYQNLLVTLSCFVVLTFGVDWISSTARRTLR
jgi:phosphonate transport system permease protein